MKKVQRLPWSVGPSSDEIPSLPDSRRARPPRASLSAPVAARNFRSGLHAGARIETFAPDARAHGLEQNQRLVGQRSGGRALGIGCAGLLRSSIQRGGADMLDHTINHVAFLERVRCKLDLHRLTGTDEADGREAVRCTERQMTLTPLALLIVGVVMINSPNSV